MIGLWHLGTVTAACLASLGHHVVAVDDDKDVIRNLRQGRPPLFEPGLEELIRTGLSAGRLTFTSDLAEALPQAEYVWLAFDTPVDGRDEADLSPILHMVTRIAPLLAPDTVMVLSSQVPVGTCRRFLAAMGKESPGRPGGLVYLPENLRLGQAIERFIKPDMLVIGAADTEIVERVEMLLGRIEAPRYLVSFETAEMVKHTINAYLSTCISFINEISAICEFVGADAVDVARVLRSDRRVSPHAPLSPGMGFAGGTLARDLRILLHLAGSLDYHPNLLEGVLAGNAWQNRVVIRKLQVGLGVLEGKRVAVLGLTYKAGTDTLRRSAAVETVEAIVQEGASVAVFDPKADPGALRQGNVTISSDPYEAAHGADAVAFMTPWPEFRRLDFPRLLGGMRGTLVVDSQNMLDMAWLIRLGFTYAGIGRGLSSCGIPVT